MSANASLNSLPAPRSSTIALERGHAFDRRRQLPGAVGPVARPPGLALEQRRGQGLAAKRAAEPGVFDGHGLRRGGDAPHGRRRRPRLERLVRRRPLAARQPGRRDGLWFGHGVRRRRRAGHQQGAAGEWSRGEQRLGALGIPLRPRERGQRWPDGRLEHLDALVERGFGDLRGAVGVGHVQHGFGTQLGYDGVGPLHVRLAHPTKLGQLGRTGPQGELSRQPGR
mmetsp:Transcript_15297/g.40415  ORF Transcript_15297/g.40415 Transcript_15297/m.40415 type:complete len:225 (+) Transcript_15297:696-1370(+)